MSRREPGGSPTHSPVVGVDALGEGQLWGRPLNHSNQRDFKTLQMRQKETSYVQRLMAFPFHCAFFQTSLSLDYSPTPYISGDDLEILSFLLPPKC